MRTTSHSSSLHASPERTAPSAPGFVSLPTARSEVLVGILLVEDVARLAKLQQRSPAMAERYRPLAIAWGEVPCRSEEVGGREEGLRLPGEQGLGVKAITAPVGSGT